MATRNAQALALARLDDAIGLVCSVPEACARDPARDFTRSRKLPLPKLVRLMVTWGGDTIPVELNDAFGWDGTAPTASAFCRGALPAWNKNTSPVHVLVREHPVHVLEGAGTRATVQRGWGARAEYRVPRSGPLPAFAQVRGSPGASGP